MKSIKNKLVAGLTLASAMVAMACVTDYNPTCPDIGTDPQECSSHSSDSGCQTTDTETLNQVMDTGNSMTQSSGKCTYECFYWDSNGVQVGCGYVTNSWTGYKPDGNLCPNNG